MAICPELAATLAMLACAVRGARDDWWLIGSAAVALDGGEAGRVADVDLLMSARDADALLTRVDGVRGAEPSDHFRSAVFGTWRDSPLPIDIFGGFTVMRDGAWQPVSFATRAPVTVGGAELYLPARHELVALLRAFGRPKDLERARSLTNSPRKTAGS